MNDKTCKLIKGEIPYFILNILDRPEVFHAFSARLGGVSQGCYHSLNLNLSVGDEIAAVERNRRLFCQATGITLENLVTMEQTHSDQVIVVDRQKNTPIPGDALITKQINLALAVQTADCVPVLVADPVNKIVAAVHAGWRGTLANILGKTLQQMICLGASLENCLVGIGPCIGACCYQVDEQVINQFRGTQMSWEQFSASEGKGRWRLDLAGINQWQAQAAGVPSNRIARLDLCTACRPDLFYSYRREGKTGRMMSAIALSEKAR